MNQAAFRQWIRIAIQVGWKAFATNLFKHGSEANIAVAAFWFII